MIVKRHATFTSSRSGLLLKSIFTLLATACSAIAYADTPACVEPNPLPNEIPGAAIADGQIDAAVAKVDQLAHDLMASSGIPGMAVAVVHNGQMVYAKGFGVRSVNTGVAVDADSVFQLASVSKSIGATVVAHQVGKKVVSWDTPVQALMPSFKLSDPYVSSHATIADMYAHRSGLPEHAADLLEDLGYNRVQMLDRLQYLSLKPFRSTYGYTNFGMTAGAEAVAIASGSDWATLSQHMIYEPLGMTSTSSRYADFIARGNRAVGHIKVDGKFQVTSPERQPDAQSPAGGVSSSVNDMARWMNMVLEEGHANGQIIVDRDALLAAISPQIVSGAPSKPQARASLYGYGFNVGNSAAGRVVLTHSGAFALGAATAFTLIPSARIGIVTLTNAEPAGVPETLNAEFADLVQSGKITQDWKTLYGCAFAGLLAASGELHGKTPPANPVPARALSEYQSTYHNTYYGKAKVNAVNGQLILTLGPAGLELPLRHWDGDIFVFTPPGESAPQGSISKATFGDDDLKIEYLSNEYSGTFTKRDITGAKK